MAVVFVHGVNTRDGAEYERDVAARTELLRRLLLKPLGSPFDQMSIQNSYWGNYGVTFAWNNACLPEVETMKHMGAGDGQTPLADAELARVIGELDYQGTPAGLDSMGGGARSLKRAAVKDPARVAEAVLAPLILSEKNLNGPAGATAEEDGCCEALILIAATEAAEEDKTIAEIQAAANDGEVIDIIKGATLDRIQQRLTPAPAAIPGLTRMGSVDDRWQAFNDRVAELFNRAKAAPARAATVASLDLYRSSLHQNFARFIGDVFVYLQRRGPKETPGPIIRTVRDTIATAHERNPSEPMIVVTHSMGGNIVYDLLTFYAPELKVDIWVSVASQIGFFEEMKIFQASDTAVQGPDKVNTLPKLKVWMNVYDPADILAFKTAPIFNAAKIDLPFLTGDSALKAHGAYFKRPSFYRLLLNEFKNVAL